jgi:hypothetical protein
MDFGTTMSDCHRHHRFRGLLSIFDPRHVVGVIDNCDNAIIFSGDRFHDDFGLPIIRWRNSRANFAYFLSVASAKNRFNELR